MNFKRLYDLKSDKEWERFLKDAEYHRKKGDVVKFDREPEMKTLQQLRYAWVIVSLSAIELGYTKDEFYQILRHHPGGYFDEHFTGSVTNQKTGQIISYKKGFSEFTDDEMSKFIDNFRDFMNDYYNVYLPTSDEYKASRAYYENNIAVLNDMAEKFK